MELARSEGKKLKDILVWVPYIEKISQDDFNKAVDQIVMMIPPCTRLVRLQRDFVKSKAQFKTPDIEELLPEATDDDMSLCGWVSSKLHSNEAQLIDNRLKKNGYIPIEIKSREIRNTYIKNLEEGAYIYCMKHMNMDRLEYYVSVEYPSVPGQYAGSYTLGHVRCRIQPTNMLQVRELHVYGMVKPASSTASSKISKQHRGFGKILMKAAETIAMHHGCTTVQVISGVGVRDYYRKLGYSLTEPGEYMTLTPRGPRLNLNLPRSGEVAITSFGEARSVPVNRRPVVVLVALLAIMALVALLVF
jgi:histone acetyltransferase (RNA polymerase elongator complex component)